MMRYDRTRKANVSDVWAHYAYCIIRLNDTSTAECFYRWHPDLVWC